VGTVFAAKHRKNSKLKLYNQFLFCNSFLLFVRYLHGGHEDMFFRQEDMLENDKIFFLMTSKFAEDCDEVA